MDWKKIGKKLLFPPIYVLMILVLVSAGALTLVFVRGMEETIPAYIVYVLASYNKCDLCAVKRRLSVPLKPLLKRGHML